VQAKKPLVLVTSGSNPTTRRASKQRRAPPTSIEVQSNGLTQRRQGANVIVVATGAAGRVGVPCPVPAPAAVSLPAMPGPRAAAGGGRRGRRQGDDALRGRPSVQSATGASERRRRGGGAGGGGSAGPGAQQEGVRARRRRQGRAVDAVGAQSWRRPLAS
jgi:hypothetical protein